MGRFQLQNGVMSADLKVGSPTTTTTKEEAAPVPGSYNLVVSAAERVTGAVLGVQHPAIQKLVASGLVIAPGMTSEGILTAILGPFIEATRRMAILVECFNAASEGSAGHDEALKCLAASRGLLYCADRVLRETEVGCGPPRAGLKAAERQKITRKSNAALQSQKPKDESLQLIGDAAIHLVTLIDTGDVVSEWKRSFPQFDLVAGNGPLPVPNVVPQALAAPPAAQGAGGPIRIPRRVARRQGAVPPPQGANRQQVQHPQARSRSSRRIAGMAPENNGLGQAGAAAPRARAPPAAPRNVGPQVPPQVPPRGLQLIPPPIPPRNQRHGAVQGAVALQAGQPAPQPNVVPLGGRAAAVALIPGVPPQPNSNILQVVVYNPRRPVVPAGNTVPVPAPPPPRQQHHGAARLAIPVTTASASGTAPPARTTSSTTAMQTFARNLLGVNRGVQKAQGPVRVRAANPGLSTSASTVQAPKRRVLQLPGPSSSSGVQKTPQGSDADRAANRRAPQRLSSPVPGTSRILIARRRLRSSSMSQASVVEKELVDADLESATLKMAKDLSIAIYGEDLTVEDEVRRDEDEDDTMDAPGPSNAGNTGRAIHPRSLKRTVDAIGAKSWLEPARKRRSLSSGDANEDLEAARADESEDGKKAEKPLNFPMTGRQLFRWGAKKFAEFSKKRAEKKQEKVLAAREAFRKRIEDQKHIGAEARILAERMGRLTRAAVQLIIDEPSHRVSEVAVGRSLLRVLQTDFSDAQNPVRAASHLTAYLINNHILCPSNGDIDPTTGKPFLVLGDTFRWSVLHRSQTADLVKKYEDILETASNASAASSSNRSAFSNRSDTRSTAPNSSGLSDCTVSSGEGGRLGRH